MGEELENVTQNFVLLSTDISGDGEALLVQPWANVEKCTKCGICKKRGPVNAITLSPYPVIDYDLCISSVVTSCVPRVQ